MPERLLRLSTNVLAALAFAAAGIVMLAIALGAALVIEHRTGALVTASLAEAQLDWAVVETDGLQVRLSGTAPDEAARFRALNLAGTLVDSARVRDRLDVAPASALAAPNFLVEMLRNDDGIQLIGLFPETPGEGGMAAEELAEAANALSTDTQVINMLQTAAYPPPETWNRALAFGFEALRTLKRSKISVAADRVEVTAIAESEAEKRALESQLADIRPEGVFIDMDISAPRPVLTPFTLRFLKDETGARFDACSADTERARARIVAAAAAAGLSGTPDCTVGMGTPTPRWADGVLAAIQAVDELGNASVTFSDADITLTPGPGITQAAYDRVVGELRAALPDVFSLEAIAPQVETAEQGPAEFTAQLSTEGRVVLRGRLVDEAQQTAVEAFARAAFAADAVHTATRLDSELPDGWPIRVLAGLEALAELHDGSLLVRADLVEVKGATGSQEARARITQILSARLGQGATFRVDVRYDEELDPLAALPTPEECAAGVAAVVAVQKITFTPGSAEIASIALPVLQELAAVLEECTALPMEIAGHTDSQGSEGGNLALSQARAEAVLLALQGRRVDVSEMTAKGYGEAVPIADNETEAGREANRRIEFVLKGTGATAEAGPAGTAATPEAGSATEGTAPEGAATAGPAEAPAAGEAAAEGAAPAAAAGDPAAPDFSDDQSPSVAPTEMTIRPKERPAQDG